MIRSPTYDKVKNVQRLANNCHSDLVLFVYLGLVPMHTCVKCEGSKVNHVGRRGTYKKNEKWLPLKKKISHENWANMCIYAQDMKFL